jgi:hypothetical protein
MQLNLEQIRVFFVVTRLPKIQEMELKPFLTILGTRMRATISIGKLQKIRISSIMNNPKKERQRSCRI